MPRSEREVLVEYVLRDEENLSLALNIAEAREDICDRVVVEFVAAVASRLAGILGDAWAVRVGTPEEIEPYDAMYLYAEYRPHPGKFTLGIYGEGARHLKKMYFAVRSDAGTEYHETVKAQLDEVLQGKIGDVSLWYWYLKPDKYTWWGGDEATRQLHHNGEALDYFASYLEKLARAVERSLAPPP